MAVNYGLNPESCTKIFTFYTKETHSQLSDAIRVVKGIKRADYSFFLRAESFYNLATTID
ncbi:hypothetical protein [Listeria goaensis]|uniref:hypothetical protein n=1 Tax=Listeria goaensis TaxID=1649188 RepID=UPI000B597F6E|nr:hypothetical protein [Listeria goaensis]